MTLTIEVEDKKAKFVKDLLGKYSFIKVQDEILDEDTDEQVLENIRKGLQELKLVEQGKVKSRPAREFLKEL